MKPRHVIAQSDSYTGEPLSLIEHDGRLYLECGGRLAAASHLGTPAKQLMTTLSRPFRPARKPLILFLGLGFGHAIQAAGEALPQEKAAFVVFPESPDLVKWLSDNLADNPIDDERVHLESSGPFLPIGPGFQDAQAIYADLDHLDALAPKNWSIISPKILSNYYGILKNGGLLGLLSTRPVPLLEKELRKTGFEVVTDQVPLSNHSRKHRTLYLARKGHYQRSSQN